MPKTVTFRVALPNGAFANVHGRLTTQHGRFECEKHYVHGFVYVSGARVYGYAENWGITTGRFRIFVPNPSGKHAHLVQPYVSHAM